MKSDYGKYFAAAVILVMLLAPASFADSTLVLPKGRSAATLGWVTTAIDREFDNGGKNRELGFYLNNTDITLLADLVVYQGLVDAGFPPAIINPFLIFDDARTFLKADVKVDALLLDYRYGITDRLTASLTIPFYLRAKSDVDFRVVLRPSAVAESTILPSPPLPPGVSLADYIRTMNATQLAQDYLHNQFGYDPIESWKGDPGLGDIQLGLKYLFLNSKMFKAAAGGYQKFPTGKKDDETNLTDIPYGTGSYDTGIFAMLDVIPVKPLTWNITGRYIFAWPYRRTVYVLDPANPSFYQAELPTKKVSGKYDIGDWFELESELNLDVTKFVNLFAGWFYLESRDYTIAGDTMPKEARRASKYYYGLGFSTVDWYLRDKFAVPFILRFYGEQNYDGRNYELQNRYIVTLTVPF